LDINTAWIEKRVKRKIFWFFGLHPENSAVAKANPQDPEAACFNIVDVR
jgi:hypothetical protein